MRKAMSMCLVAVSALVILTGCGRNIPPEPDSVAYGGVVVNIEGTVCAVDGSQILLDSGKLLVISEDTVFGDSTSDQVSDKFEVGNFVQGYTNDDPTLSKVTAAYIYSNVAQKFDGG